jgi:hypothetical protein
MEPWVVAAGEVLGWNGSAWTPQVPQPELHYQLLVGTVCDTRGHHDMSVVGEDHVICDDCGWLVETEPDDE